MNKDYDMRLEIEQLANTSNATIEDFYKAGIELANSEANYQIKLRAQALIERAQGVPVTMISTFIKGHAEVAELRQKRDICESRYKMLENKINSIKLQMRVLDAQASREWTKND